ncbi:MAG: sugar phosphate nucleotidyltransferase [Actinomycetota bacterium]
MTRRSPIGSILFAAGRGKRLSPLSDVVPKPVLPMLDVPLAAFILGNLTASAPPVVVNVSHLERRVRSALAGHGAEFMLEKPEAFGTGGTLAALRDRVGGRIVTANADLLTDLDAGALLAAHACHGAPATIAVEPVERGADVEIEKGRAVALFDRRVRPDKRGALFLGIAVFERTALDLLPERRPLGLTEGLLRPLIERGDVALHEHLGYALDVGTIERYVEGSMDLLASRGPKPPGRWPGDIVAVEGGAAFLGRAASAERKSLGPGAILLERSAVAPGARVERAIVWPQERVPPGARLSYGLFAFARFFGVTGSPRTRRSSPPSIS